MSEPVKRPENKRPESYSPKRPEIIAMARQAGQSESYPESFMLPDRGERMPPEIRHIGPSYVAFANEFSYFMDYTGQGSGFLYEGEWRMSKDYMFADIITGHALRPCAALTPTREELFRVYRAAGFSPTSYSADPREPDYVSEADMKEIIMYALCGLEQPVLLPTDDGLFGSIVVGYKDGGNVLIVCGYKPYFMDMENNAQLIFAESADWYNGETILTVVGRRERAVPEREMHREGLRQIYAYLYSNIRGEDRHYFGEWESFLRLSKSDMISYVKRTLTVPGGTHDSVSADMDDGAAWAAICESHDSTWCDMAERRFYVSQFLYKIMGGYPDDIKESMKHLADNYWESSKIMGGDYGGDEKIGYGREVGDPVNPEVFEAQDVRERMADCVRIFKEADEKGLELAEELLAKCEAFFISPDSYTPKKPEIVEMVKSALAGGQSPALPHEHIITPENDIAPFSGEAWPFSNVEPAVYSALGLLYGRTERRDDSGALINDDIEYAIHNVLTGHAFGLFFDALGEELSRALYGFSCLQLEADRYTADELQIIIATQISRGSAVHIDSTSEPFDYLIWGYKDGGGTLLGYRFEHGNDMVNSAFDLNNPAEFESLIPRLNGNDLFKPVMPIGQKPGSITFILPGGEKAERDAVYRQALNEGCRMLTQAEPNPEMDAGRVHFGYGQAIYDEWTRQIGEADAKDSGEFFDTSPIFPHFFALHENRLQILRFLKHLNERTNNEYLHNAINLCERLKTISLDAAFCTAEGGFNPMINSTNHERRTFLLDALRESRALEVEIARQIRQFLDSTGGLQKTRA